MSFAWPFVQRSKRRLNVFSERVKSTMNHDPVDF